jgi:hypothetical protein
MPDYPILVERFDDKHPADLAVCTGCDRTSVVDPGDGDPYDLCMRCGSCGEQVVMKYDEAPACKNCNKLGWWEETTGYCCSRVCQLQAEYASSLGEVA